MDTLTVVSDVLDSAICAENVESLFQMADDYKFQILMSELGDELNF
jgi:hypothetical protein